MNRWINKRSLIALLLLLGLASCASLKTRNATPVLSELDLPDTIHGRIPRLSKLSDGVLMSWVQKERHHARLTFATLKNGHWSTPIVAAEGDNWLINYADYANVSALDDRHYIASWLVKTGPRGANYHFMVAQSFDAGKHWSEPSTGISFGQLGEHGFVTLQADGRDVLVAWISADRQIAGNYQIYSARLDAAGNWHDTQLVDHATCSCCHPDLATRNGKIMLAYRNRSEDEIRDIALMHYKDGQWSLPEIVHHDGWHINGCPVQGPALSATSQGHVTLWFTAANDHPAVNMAARLSSGHRVFKQLEGGDATGYVDSTVMDDGRVMLLWLSIPPKQGIKLHLQAIDLKNGQFSPALNRTMTRGVIGFPSIQSFGRKVFVAYEGYDQSVKLLQLKNP